FLLALAQPAFAAEKLWTEWYLVSQKGAPVSLFEETAEKRAKEGELAITQRWVEKLDGDRTETYIGSVSSSQSLAPVAFFVERKGAKPYKTDGRVKNKQLEVTFKPGTPDLAKSTELTPVGAGYYFSSFLPSAISRHFLGGKESFAFTAVVEDGGDMNVEVKKGQVDVGTASKKIGKETCRLAVITFEGKVQEWWITRTGKVCLVNFPDSATKMELSTEKAAKKALKEGN
ncbi:MAG: hypothetical protein ACXWSD_00545, partial [Bdellovibrionota bacterium]